MDMRKENYQNGKCLSIIFCWIFCWIFTSKDVENNNNSQTVILKRIHPFKHASKYGPRTASLKSIKTIPNSDIMWKSAWKCYQKLFKISEVFELILLSHNVNRICNCSVYINQKPVQCVPNLFVSWKIRRDCEMCWNLLEP